MCMFLSYIERTVAGKKKVFYIDRKAYASKEMRAFLKREPSASEDMNGHSAIRNVFTFRKAGVGEREIHHLKPEYLPKSLVSAIKRGSFRGVPCQHPDLFKGDGGKDVSFISSLLNGKGKKLLSSRLKEKSPYLIRQFSTVDWLTRRRKSREQVSRIFWDIFKVKANRNSNWL